MERRGNGGEREARQEGIIRERQDQVRRGPPVAAVVVGRGCLVARPPQLALQRCEPYQDSIKENRGGGGGKEEGWGVRKKMSC